MEGKEQEFVLNLLFEIEDVQLFEVENKVSNQILKGSLGVYELKEMNLIVLAINQWKYSLNKDVPVMLQNQQDGNKLFIFPKKQGQFGILINPTNQDTYDCWISILTNNSKFVISEVLQQLNQNNQNEQSSNEKTTSKKIGNMLNEGGTFIRGGLITGGKFLQNGIVQAGSYFQQKFITKQEPKKIKEETFKKVKMANTVSKGILIFTKTQCEVLIKGAVELGKQIGEEISTSESGQKVQSNKYYPDAKNIASGTFYGIAQIYDGMYEAVCSIGRGIQDASSGAVSQKYGSEAGKVVNQGLDVVGNVGQIGRVYQDVAVKEVIKQNQHQKQQNKQLKH